MKKIKRDGFIKKAASFQKFFTRDKRQFLYKSLKMKIQTQFYEE